MSASNLICEHQLAELVLYFKHLLKRGHFLENVTHGHINMSVSQRGTFTVQVKSSLKRNKNDDWHTLGQSEIISIASAFMGGKIQCHRQQIYYDEGCR